MAFSFVYIHPFQDGNGRLHRYLIHRRRDEAMSGIMDRVELPDRLAEDFLMFVRQHGGTLPMRRRKDAFAALTDSELADLEAIVRRAFDDC